MTELSLQNDGKSYRWFSGRDKVMHTRLDARNFVIKNSRSVDKMTMRFDDRDSVTTELGLLRGGHVDTEESAKETKLVY